MIERVLLALVLLALCAAVYRLLLVRQLRRVRQSAPADPLLAHVPAGLPAIVYFTTPTCAPCRFYITPLLKQLQAEVGEQRLRIIRVDATEDTEAADRWGVFSVPTVFVLDSNHQPRGVYDGGVTSAALRQALVNVMQCAENLTDEGFDFSMLSEFRQRLLEPKAGEHLLNTPLEQFVEAGSLSSGGK